MNVDDAIDQPQLALLDQHHHAGGRRHHLGQRREIEDRVERHRFARRHLRAVADRLLVDDAVAQADEHDCPGQPPLLDLLADQRLDRVQLLEIDGGRRRPRLRRPARRRSATVHESASAGTDDPGRESRVCIGEPLLRKPGVGPHPAFGGLPEELLPLAADPIELGDLPGIDGAAAADDVDERLAVDLEDSAGRRAPAARESRSRRRSARRAGCR